MLVTGYWMLDACYWILDAECLLLDTGCWMLFATEPIGNKLSGTISNSFKFQQQSFILLSDRRL
ncbi:hypothetical protein D3OALGB2SA_1045 [Olavius algarvensis associated proteobacterium Delta 3]|nr:hypothetical protein D3OALGB2SA_1045 [Olavius algarvensis associated proteobacterium Delta 3]